jgi:hypothetical protein
MQRMLVDPQKISARLHLYSVFVVYGRWMQVCNDMPGHSSLKVSLILIHPQALAVLFSVFLYTR